MTTALKITNLRARPVLVPFKRPPMSASGGIPAAALVLIDLQTDGGVTGRSYVFGFAPWTLKPIVACLEAILEMIKGDAPAPVEIEAKLRARLTLLDTPGLVGLALAGIDMAAWDALAQAHAVPLVRLLGGALRSVPAYKGYARIAAEVGTPIQTGENLVDTFEMARAIAAQSLDFVMPDVQRIGGVTGWLRAAALAHAHGIEMSSHLFPEFSVHLLGVTPTCHWLEFMDWAEPVIQEPVTVKDGLAQIPDRPGSGIIWNEDAVRRYAA